MKHIGHTLFGDARYGGDNILKGTTFTSTTVCGQLLQTTSSSGTTRQKLGFVHPISGKSMSFEAPLPNDMFTALDKWRHYAKHGWIEDALAINTLTICNLPIPKPRYFYKKLLI